MHDSLGGREQRWTETCKEQLEPMRMTWKPPAMMGVSYRIAGALIYGATCGSGPGVQEAEWGDFTGASVAAGPLVATGMGAAPGGELAGAGELAASPCQWVSQQTCNSMLELQHRVWFGGLILDGPLWSAAVFRCVGILSPMTAGNKPPGSHCSSLPRSLFPHRAPEATWSVGTGDYRSAGSGAHTWEPKQSLHLTSSPHGDIRCLLTLSPVTSSEN